MSKRDIENRAKQILMDHGLYDRPVDPLKVAQSLGVKVLHAKFSETDKSGVVTKKGDHAAIYLNYKDSPIRKRFTVAHEIGHYILHMLESNDDSEFIDDDLNFRSTILEDDWTPEKRKEWEANYFAASLLMDADLLTQEWKNNRSPEDLARIFQVSEQAMRFRLASLELLEIS